MWYAWGREKAEAKLCVGPGEGGKQTGHNMATICTNELHNQLAMADLREHSVSPEKTHLNWAADVQGQV